LWAGVVRELFENVPYDSIEPVNCGLEEIQVTLQNLQKISLCRFKYCRRSTMRMTAVILFCCLVVATSCARIPSQKGAVFGAEEWSPLYNYSTSEAEQQLKRLRATGANWVRILVTWFQNTINDTTIYRIDKPSLLATATDDELEYVIKLAHRMEFKVMLSPIIDPDWTNRSNHRSGPDMTWRGLIGLYFTDAQWKTWFENYNNYVTKYAIMAQRLGVEQFCIGAELNTPFSRPTDMRNTIKSEFLRR